MKHIVLLITLCFICIYCTAQVKLSDKDFNNLISLSQLYSQNNMATGNAFAKAADALRTPVLNNMVDVLIATGKQDSTVLQPRFINRPTNDEMLLWYVLREIHYNRIDTSKKPFPDPDVARKVLAETIDERLLLDNYYYRLQTGLAMLFNTADLSTHNFDLGNMEFKNDTEKAIFFHSIMSALANGRFQVLHYLKKTEKLTEKQSKMPLFNGKPYYYYTNLDIPDFEITGYKKKESYQEVHVGNFISTLLIQFSNMASTGDNMHARELYFNSILHKPEYFKYSKSKDDLQGMYDKAN